MAATDKFYRTPRTLDIVFAVSCILMLVSVVVMFAQDYYRPFKVVQREFRDVESTVFERAMLERLPDEKTLDAVAEAERLLAEARKAVAGEEAKVGRQLRDLQVQRARFEVDLQGVKATYDSLVSLRNIDVDEGHSEAARAKETQLRDLEKQMAELQSKVDETRAKMDEVKKPVRELEQQKARELYQTLIEKGLAPPVRIEEIRNLSQVEDPIKKATADFDRLAKTTAQKQWGLGDWFRALPVIDGFASPYRIEQYTLENLPIDYNFKRVTRYDRCVTCHQGIERGTFDRETLTRLKDAPDGLQGKLDRATAFLKSREKRGESLGFSLGDLPSKVKPMTLTPAQITQFAAHPRLDLFVDSNSPHPAEKFGCTICHSGQGSATEFTLAAHTPSNVRQRRQWEEDHHWHSSHYWDFPMLPTRFKESSCLKCHHEVTDLIRFGSREEAPKLLRGYNLVRENGCFGCHEIAGLKAGRAVGPDMRLEPSPPLDALTPAERVKALSDPLNPPGKLRKVGPSLQRLAEKTNEEWTRKWIQSPRDFRPDTRMPHFYDLSNNLPGVLPADQKDFPAAEIHAITHYLFRESKAYLDGKDKYHNANDQRKKQLEAKQKDNTISERERRELIEVQRRLELAKPPVPLLKDGKLHIVDGEGNVIAQLPAASTPEQRIDGARLFREKGCLACHSNDATAIPEKDKQGPIPAVVSEADFGPNLSRLAAKIGPADGNAEAKRAWLVQWIMNPNVHFPRTRMPITHLNVDEAARLADWLLSVPVNDWDQPDVPAPGAATLVNLAAVYLRKAPGVTQDEVKKFLDDGIPTARLSGMPLDADERELEAPVTDDKLKWYIGRKAINRLGCYACHTVPGFEFAKPVGTPLNDWGKKDPERLAFEDAKSFVQSHFNYEKVYSRDPREFVPDGKKEPFERFFFDALEHHQRDGFLHLKLAEPRSFDYRRERTWDDRLRMPQFQFARSKKKDDESDEAFRARSAREEAEAREAVMTFVLGLVAEPIPPEFLNKPEPDRLAEVKGRQVLDKFNCGGCHQVRSGVYEFRLTNNVINQLQEWHDTAQAARGASDLVFPDDNAWQGRPSPIPGRLLVRGFPTPSSDDEKQLRFWLTEAVRFTNNGEKKPQDIPAGELLELPIRDAVTRSAPFGGTFTNLMVDYAKGRGIPLVSAGGAAVDDRWARSSLPPPLLREGERVQPDWLFRFLLDPDVIRPQQQRDGQGVMFLRMPRFNMSEEEAQTLVNYFGGSDRRSNPGMGLTYPYLTMPQREEGFWREKTAAYARQLGEKGLEQKAKELIPLWIDFLQDELTELERKLKQAEAAKEAVEKAPDAKKEDAKKALAAAEKAREVLEVEVKKRKAQVDMKDVTDLRRQWEQHGVYAADAYRLIGIKGPCMSCHQVQGQGDTKGPPLDLASARLRPEWTARWLANPRRLFAYETPMVQNFPRDKKDYQNIFEGASLEQVRAVRDLLMNFPKEAALPANRYYRQTTP